MRQTHVPVNLHFIAFHILFFFFAYTIALHPELLDLLTKHVLTGNCVTWVGHYSVWDKYGEIMRINAYIIH